MSDNIKLPVQVGDEYPDELYDADGNDIAQFWGEQRNQYAAEVMRRVNLHDELVEALLLAVEGLDVAAKKGGPAFLGYVFAGDKGRHVLSKAEASQDVIAKANRE